MDKKLDAKPRVIKEYKCRAEQTTDVLRVIQTVESEIDFYCHSNNFFIKRIGKAGDEDFKIEFSFESDMEIDEIRLYWKRSKDTHVMIDTLNYKNEYTG